MGIYDRDYYRREGPSFLGAFGGRGQVCKWLIAVNVACFVLQMLGDRVTLALELDTYEVRSGQVWRLLTYAFLHDTRTPWHILFNMLFLWWFGSELEDRYGPREFLTFYLLAALIGGLVFQLGWAAGWRPDDIRCLGASGAVTAVMVLFALHFPTRTIYVFGLLPLPIWALVVLNVLQDLGVVLGSQHSGTAVTVHLGGAGFGVFYYWSGWKLTGLLGHLHGWSRSWSKPRLRVYREDARQPVAVASPPAAPEVDEHLEAKLDAVLEKVARLGRDSLTDAERQILLRASEAFKKRRT